MSTSEKTMKLSMNEMIADRVAKELKGPLVVNLGIGIPTLVPQFINDPNIYLHTENGLLGVTDIDENHIDPNLVNAGKKPIGEDIGASFFDSAASFAMIRGNHVDVAILGTLQVDEKGIIANWAVPGKNIIGVGGAMDLIVGAKKVIVATTHTTKDGKPKIIKQCSYPITSLRPVDMIVTELAVFEMIDSKLTLTEIMPNSSIELIKEKTEADFVVQLANDKRWS